MSLSSGYIPGGQIPLPSTYPAYRPGPPLPLQSRIHGTQVETLRPLSSFIKTNPNGTKYSPDITLKIRQQPKEALVTVEGKEKARKPIDPPPIIQIEVTPYADPHQHYLQSPHLFMCVNLVKANRDGPLDDNSIRPLTGSLTSSLHRLKDIDNKEAGFFIFGDISVKVVGSFRLEFVLFDLQQDHHGLQAICLASVRSDAFQVLQQKDYKGLEESTYLSRTFSDQGVRLRLRKESRNLAGQKRRYQPEDPVENTPQKRFHPQHQQQSYLPSTGYLPSTSNLVTASSMPSSSNLALTHESSMPQSFFLPSTGLPSTGLPSTGLSSTNFAPDYGHLEYPYWHQ